MKILDNLIPVPGKTIEVEVHRGAANFTIIRNVQPAVPKYVEDPAVTARREARIARKRARRQAEMATVLALTPDRLEALKLERPELAPACERALAGSKTAKRTIAKALVLTSTDSG